MWKQTNFRIGVFGGLLYDEAYETMKANDPERIRLNLDKFLEHDEATIVENEHGEYAFCANDVYYPLHLGHWTREEFTELIDDETGEIEEVPEMMDYNAIVEFEGLNQLLCLDRDLAVPLRFVENQAVFYQEDGSLAEEPKESLAELEALYDEVREKNDSDCREKMEKYEYLINLKIMHINEKNRFLNLFRAPKPNEEPADGKLVRLTEAPQFDNDGIRLDEFWSRPIILHSDAVTYIEEIELNCYESHNYKGSRLFLIGIVPKEISEDEERYLCEGVPYVDVWESPELVVKKLKDAGWGK